MYLGKILNLSQDELTNLYYGSLLHDIGKVACPVEILEKPDKLTEEEMKIMKCHVVYTNQILKGLIDPTVVKIASRHHERCNGLGYPSGFNESQLTISEKITAVADVVSALVCKRSYKGAFDKETTIKILTAMKEDNQLCPLCVDKVICNFEAIIEKAMLYGKPITLAYNNIQSEYISSIEFLESIKI